MKEIVKNLLECALNCEDFKVKQQLDVEIRNLLDTLQNTINCPSNWRDTKEELQEEYAENNDALEIIGY